MLKRRTIIELFTDNDRVALNLYDCNYMYIVVDL